MADEAAIHQLHSKAREEYNSLEALEEFILHAQRNFGIDKHNVMLDEVRHQKAELFKSLELLDV